MVKTMTTDVKTVDDEIAGVLSQRTLIQAMVKSASETTTWDPLQYLAELLSEAEDARDVRSSWTPATWTRHNEDDYSDFVREGFAIDLGSEDYSSRFDDACEALLSLNEDSLSTPKMVTAVFKAIGLFGEVEDDGVICGELVKATLTELKRLEIPRDMPLDQLNTIWHTGHVGDDWGSRHGAVSDEDNCPTGCEVAMTVQDMRIHNEITEDGGHLCPNCAKSSE